jgi:hypothetical protein
MLLLIEAVLILVPFETRLICHMAIVPYRNMGAEMLSPTYPLPPKLAYPARASSTKGRFARRREEDEVAVSRGPDGHIRHSGDAGAPPGTTTSPCQELADDLDAALSAFGLLEREERDRP